MRTKIAVLVVCLGFGALTSACVGEVGEDGEAVADESAEATTLPVLPAAVWWKPGTVLPLPSSGRFLVVVGRRNIAYGALTTGFQFVAYGVNLNSGAVVFQMVGWEADRNKFLGEYEQQAGGKGASLGWGSTNAGTAKVPVGPPPPPGDDWRVATWARNTAKVADQALQTAY